MMNQLLPRMACSGAILALALAHCGCQSTKGSTGLASAWSKPKPSNPNNREVVTYLGQKKDKPKKPDIDELKERMSTARDEGAASRQPLFDSHLRQGNQALRANNLVEARKEYENALALRPDDPDCHHRLAVVADKERQFALADEHYEAALKKRPRDPNLLSDMGYSYSLRGDERRAEATLEQALNISPSHKGAMANLGAIFAKQDRFEDAQTMFRRGVTEVEAQQYLTQLFPNRPGSGIDARGLASNTNPRSAPPMPNDAQNDFRGMSPEQLRERMNQERSDGIQRRREQQMAEMQPPRRDWMNDGAPNSHGSNSAPIMLGPGSQSNSSMNQYSSANQYQQGNDPMNSGNAQGFANQGYATNNQGANPYGQGSRSNGFQNNPAEGSLTAPPGTTPNINLWNGGVVRDNNLQYAGGQSGANRSGSMTNSPYYSQPGSQPGQFGGSANPYALAGSSNQRPLGGLNLQPSVGSLPNLTIPADSSASAAAQLGMNVGPGGLLPVVASDAGPMGSGPGQPGGDSRFGAEFPSAPSYQNPAYQNSNQFQQQPARSAFLPDSRQNSGWGGSGNQSGRSPYGTSGTNGASNSNQPFAAPLGPDSPASGWPQIPGGNINQAGGAMPFNSSAPRINDPMDRGNEQGATWADKPNLNGAAPYNGSWPQPSQSGASAGIPNSIPAWGNDQPNIRPIPRQMGSNSSGNSPEPWPYRPQ